MNAYEIALQPRALVGGAAFIVYRWCGLMGGRGVRMNQTNYPWILHCIEQAD